MFSVSVEQGFIAHHHVRLPDGTWEEPHAHDWRVRAIFRNLTLDKHAMVVDFIEVQDALHQILASLHETDLNQNPALDGAIPTAEIVAHYLFTALIQAGWQTLARIEVTEAPGCIAAYETTDPSIMQNRL